MGHRHAPAVSRAISDPDRAPAAPDDHSSARALAALLVVAVAVGIVFTLWRPSAIAIGARVPAMVLVALVVAGYLVLATPRGRHILAQPGALWNRRHARVSSTGASTGPSLLWPLALYVLLMAYCAYWRLPLGARAVAYALLLGGPAAALWPVRQRSADGVAPARVLAVTLALLVPIAARWLPPIPVPGPGATNLLKLVAVAHATWCFTVLAPVRHLGYTLPGSRTAWWRAARLAVLGVAATAVLVIPLGIGLGFLTWRPQVDVSRLVLLPLLLAITTAVPEELAFRGFVQGPLVELLGGSTPGPVGARRRLLGRVTALGLASALFGLVHLPDPRYALLAAIAGAVYGVLYLRTGTLLASVLVHTGVDWVWALLLRG